jgi:hypothetical protein
MPEGRRLWGRLTVLAAAVLALHLWWLAGVPRVLTPMRAPPSWNIRTLAAVAGPVAASVPAAPGVPAVPAAPAAATNVHRERSTSPAGSTGASPAVATRSSSADPAPHSAAPITRFQVLAPTRLAFQVTASTRGIITEGQAALHWWHDGTRYEAQLELNGAGLRSRSQRSSGLVTPQGLAPLRFSDKARSEEAAHFERDSGKLSFSSNRPDSALEAGAQDRLSVVLQLGAMLAADAARFPAGARIVLQTATTREAQSWVFVVEGAEALQLPGGELTALKLSREPVGPYDGKLELWLAPAAAYAPVRLRLTQPNGDWVDQQWSSTDR